MKEFFRPLKRLLLQLLLLLSCYFLSRCIFTLIHLGYFEGLTPGRFFFFSLAALRFDIAALLTINALYIFLLLAPVPWRPGKRASKAIQLLFIVTNFIALLFEISDWAYFPFNHKRATAEVLDMILRKSDFVQLLPRFLLDFWYIPVFVVVLLAVFIFCNRRICARTAPGAPATPLPMRLLRFIIVIPLCIIGIRGGIQLIPIGLRNAVAVAESQYVPIVLNTPFSIISTLQNDRLKELHYYDPKTLDQYFDPVKRYSGNSFRPINVMVIILESFSKEFTGIGGMKQSYTPFLDSLMGASLTCTNAFANGYHSAEGIPAVLAGIPSMQEEPFSTSEYGTNRITSLPGLLSKKGYSSAFYHGGNNGTMSFDLFCANAGFQRYVGRSEYPDENEYDGNWGIWDEPFLQFVAEDITSNLKEPFCASVFTLSSHHPFLLPRKYEGVFPKGNLKVHQTIGYTDYALRRFFERAARQPWFARTLFVIVPDHCAALSADEYYSYYQGRFAIPILYFAPGDTNLKGTYTPITQQIDILPSVMDYLGYDQPFFAFGTSIFRPEGLRYAIQYWSGSIYWTMNDYFLQTTNDNVDGFYDARNDRLCKNNLMQQKRPEMTLLLQHSRGMRQVYNDAMINNKLWVK